MLRAELLRLARAGAEARVSELQREISSLYASFPDLRRRIGGGRRKSALGRRPAVKRRRRQWTAAQRRAVALRMRRYWANRKAGKA